MATVRLGFLNRDTGSNDTLDLTVRIVRGWYDFDAIQIEGVQHHLLSGAVNEQIAGIRRAIDLDFGVVQDAGNQRKICYFLIDPDRTIDLVIALPTTFNAGVPSAGGSLANNTTYYWRVTSVDEIGETTGAVEDSVTTGAGANLTVPLTWDAMPGARKYRIYRSETTGDYAGTHFLTEVTTNSYDDDGSIALTDIYQLPSVQSLTVALRDFGGFANTWLNNVKHGRGYAVTLVDATLRTKFIP